MYILYIFSAFMNDTDRKQSPYSFPFLKELRTRMDGGLRLRYFVIYCKIFFKIHSWDWLRSGLVVNFAFIVIFGFSYCKNASLTCWRNLYLKTSFFEQWGTCCDWILILILAVWPKFKKNSSKVDPKLTFFVISKNLFISFCIKL